MCPPGRDELHAELSDDALTEDGKADHLTLAFRELDDPLGIGDRGDAGFPYPCDPILVCRATLSAGEGDACGSRGLLPCAEGLFCNYPPSAECGETDRSGTCAVAPEACIEIYQPVCGCDGQTYANACLASAAEASVRTTGACP